MSSVGETPFYLFLLLYWGLVSGRLAQLGEHHVRNVGVVGSNPMPSTKPPRTLEAKWKANGPFRC